MKPTLQNTPQVDQHRRKSGTYSLIASTGLRTLQFTLAIIIAALYGIDLSRSTKTSTPAGSEWIYAEVVAALSAITCAVHCFATGTRVGWCTWDFVLFVLWMAQTGALGNIYLRRDVDGDYVRATGSLGRMRAGVWVGLVCMVLWLGTFVLGVGWCCRARKVGDEERGYTNVVDAESESEMDESDQHCVKKGEKGVKC